MSEPILREVGKVRDGHGLDMCIEVHRDTVAGRARSLADPAQPTQVSDTAFVSDTLVRSPQHAKRCLEVLTQ